MVQPSLRDERGSVTPLFVAIMVIVLTLMVAVVDREWVNYMLKLAEQTADFAAEAGASPESREINVTATATRQQSYWEVVCVKYEEGICIESWPFRRERYETVTQTRPLRDFEQNWRAVFGCSDSDNPWTPHWKCLNPQVDAYRIVFNAASEARVMETFDRNWQDRARVSLVGGKPGLSYVIRHDATYKADTAKVIVTAELQLRSLFFGIVPPWRDTIQGASTVRFQPLQFQ